MSTLAEKLWNCCDYFLRLSGFLDFSGEVSIRSLLNSPSLIAQQYFARAMQIKQLNCLWNFYGSRDFGFIGFRQHREHFLFIMVCVFLMDRLTENKAWRKPRPDVHFRLKEPQPFRAMVSILVLNKKVRVVFSFP